MKCWHVQYYLNWNSTFQSSATYHSHGSDFYLPGSPLQLHNDSARVISSKAKWGSLFEEFDGLVWHGSSICQQN